MRDPSGDLPWEEDPTGSDVFHITDANVSMPPTVCIYTISYNIITLTGGRNRT